MSTPSTSYRLISSPSSIPAGPRSYRPRVTRRCRGSGSRRRQAERGEDEAADEEPQQRADDERGDAEPDAPQRHRPPGGLALARHHADDDSCDRHEDGDAQEDRREAEREAHDAERLRL